MLRAQIAAARIAQQLSQPRRRARGVRFGLLNSRRSIVGIEEGARYGVPLSRGTIVGATFDRSEPRLAMTENRN